MEQMTKLVAEKTARVAVEAVVGVLKERLPEGAHGFVDVTRGEQSALASSLGGVFGSAAC